MPLECFLKGVTGTVTTSTGGLSCGSTCSAAITTGTSVTLTATPDGGSTFTGWTGACSGTEACIISMDAAISVTASFALILANGACGSSNGGTFTSPPRPTSVQLAQYRLSLAPALGAGHVQEATADLLLPALQISKHGQSMPDTVITAQSTA